VVGGEHLVITLVLGGARSGKSAVAEVLAARLPPPVTYLATLATAPGGTPDPETMRRIEAHRARRPATWATVEVGTEPVGAHPVGTDAVGTDAVGTDRARTDPRGNPAGTAATGRGGLVATLLTTPGTVVFDSLGPYVAAQNGFAVDTHSVCAALRNRSGDTVVVSDEVGLGVHPETAAGRDFRDALGTVNRSVAAVADRVLLVVAGHLLPLADPGDL
jgi:adenosylcobinamide kinase/adenosylcobinamide-phosphate guanylyltransferase